MRVKESRLLFKKSSRRDTQGLYKDCVPRLVMYVYILQRNVEV